jgi:hypothetical protein
MILILGPCNLVTNFHIEFSKKPPQPSRVLILDVSREVCIGREASESHSDTLLPVCCLKAIMSGLGHFEILISRSSMRSKSCHVVIIHKLHHHSRQHIGC